MTVRLSDGPSIIRLATAVVVGVLAAAVVAATVGWPYAPAGGWMVTAAIYLAWTWLLIGPMDPAEARAHATRHDRDDSTPRMVELIVVLAAIASLAGVGYLLAAQAAGGDIAATAVGIGSVIGSWLTVHTVFTLRYARLYFPDRTIDFNQADIEPTYSDFAYLAFTVGMTYQVADTNLRSSSMRRAVLTQAMVSFVLGVVILGITINLIAGLINLH
ncbi:hypothetical protein MINS_11530 [Mycolicibacterium insubricum]|uniref:Uncharacterized protein n=1 Tax=Mycolicibacterium insubricum TaxID=444597 RepID=A0A1X0CQ84_9MYCO|nr:DUF1345 domain-containing protein [Mycolicibacterium insubricum]MCB9440778.1 DUF1345 domain-containing protein [Mycolicibacterium sp.]ORA62314.1 hypothetical protein BST26_20990 [Mycolicibacterium insubricum]BBZ65724.1 hypothetical protein MINS_11530 [Mycolicibacterium insubricum]